MLAGQIPAPPPKQFRWMPGKLVDNGFSYSLLAAHLAILTANRFFQTSGPFRLDYGYMPSNAKTWEMGSGAMASVRRGLWRKGRGKGNVIVNINKVDVVAMIKKRMEEDDNLEAAAAAAVSTFLDAPEGYRTFPAYTFLLQKLSKGSAELFPQVEKVLHHLRQHLRLSHLPSPSPSSPLHGVFIKLIRTYGRAGMLQETLRLFSAMPDPPTVLAFNAVLDILCQNGEWQMAHSLYLENVGSRIATPNSDTFNILIKALLGANKVDAALNMLGLMSENGCTPDEKTYGLIVGGLCQHGRLQQALELIDDMYSKGCPPNAITYTTFIQAFCKEGNMVDARKLLTQMKLYAAKPDTVTYTALINGYCQTGNFEQADRMLDEMLAMGCVPDVYTYTTRISALCKQGKLSEALQTLDSMQGCKPNVVTYNALITAFCKEGKANKAAELVNETMKSAGVLPNVVTYRTLVDGFCKEDNFCKANEVLGEMLEKGLVPHIDTFNSLLNGLCKHEMVGQVSRVLYEMGNRGFAPKDSTWNTLIRTLCEPLDRSQTINELQMITS